MKFWKKTLTVALLAALILGCLPLRTLAVETEEWSTEGTGMLETVEDRVQVGAQDAVLGPNAVRWIDRLAQLPDYALELYAWLEENSDGDGSMDALIDPTQAESMSGYYLTMVESIEGLTASYRVDPGISDADFKEKASEVIQEQNADALAAISSDIYDVYAAFRRDHPEVFWLSGGCQVLRSWSWRSNTDSQGNVTLTYNTYVYLAVQGPEFDVRSAQYRSVSTIRSGIAARDSQTAKILAGASGSRYEKIRYLNQWLTTHNCYNTSSNLDNLHPDCRSCIGALHGRTGTSGPVCEGYAEAFKVLCDLLGIPCVLVDGLSTNSSGTESHMWNYVQMEDGCWYAMDVTWNDPTVTGVSGAVSSYESEDYLLVGSQTVIGGSTFGISHQVRNKPTNNSTAFTNGPVLAKNKYNPSAPHSHSYEATVTAPTCTKGGYTTFTCACGNSYTGSYTAANGHTEETVPGKAATCTETGLTEGKQCSVCGEVIVAQESIPAAGHTETVLSGKAATCTETGLTEGKQCSVCNTVTAAQQTIQATGHVYDNDKDTSCNVCGEERKVQTPVDRQPVDMFRMYDPNSGEHFYTGSEEEKTNLIAAGWNYEGVGFTFPRTTGKPVYRLYDPIYGEHLYTMDENEKAGLMRQGWNLEGVAFNSGETSEVPQYRLHNPNAKRGAYHFTASMVEMNNLLAAGWEYQGIGWYSLGSMKE